MEIAKEKQKKVEINEELKNFSPRFRFDLDLGCDLGMHVKQECRVMITISLCFVVSHR